MGINQIEAKSILSKSGIPGAGYAINPYTGCTHGCVYCYACFMSRFTHHPEPWGHFLDAKVNAAEILARQLARRRKPITEAVFLSSVTDPYQPAEARFKLTRSILEVLLEHQVPISILTKSDLVLRDIDLLKQFKECSVGLSIMTTDEAIAHRFEPRASSPRRRMQALRRLRENNISTYAFISPYLPRLSRIEQLLEALDGAIDEVGIETLNTKEASWQGVKQVLNAWYPALAPGYKELCRQGRYWQDMERKARLLASRRRIEFTGLYRH